MKIASCEEYTPVDLSIDGIVYYFNLVDDEDVAAIVSLTPQANLLVCIDAATVASLVSSIHASPPV
jgi:hypothetical protein